ncbi:rCG48066, isoform CRA_e [Rattus norvegicus]|uniref:RCG48066, isoform CRA_e n=1 Tax=Rattus norvegicus TaxID=10116 RepID=A6HYT1_RAT|nr:rCG48066, isoform CRA_e [Rattus norvegicus]
MYRYHPCSGTSQRVLGRDRTQCPHVTGSTLTSPSGPFRPLQSTCFSLAFAPSCFLSWASCPVFLGGHLSGTR